ncbi:hypothetical protein ASPCAL07743 [Aspergillus calidoustus]|uniref:Uncharacterized protein n=1 Tax=Aspergillus calidoustus TaxID=454130 RepID=A0A0U5GNA2_ASPCI|nr:hypothetical protein ASPCAL07743 [Aspergillus calidoustus]
MSLNISPTSLVEQLFLDLSIQEVLTDTTNFVEPWKGMYIDAINDGRYGDAIWARYHIYGDPEPMPCACNPASQMTAMEQIKEDALAYRVNDPDIYFEALLFYATTSAADGHVDVIEVIANLSEEDIAEFKAKEEEEREDESD